MVRRMSPILRITWVFILRCASQSYSFERHGYVVMNPPVHPTSLGLVGNWQLLVAFLLRLACRPFLPLCPYAGRHPRARTLLSRSPTITRSPAPLPVEPRPDFLPPISSAPALRHHLGKHSMSLRSLGSRSWRNGLGLCIGDGLGLCMRKFRARLCYLSCFLFVFGSVDFFLVPLPWFVLVLLVLLVFACLWFRRRPTGIGRAGFLGREDVLADASIKGVSLFSSLSRS
jgi:hypothetical protein